MSTKYPKLFEIKKVLESEEFKQAIYQPGEKYETAIMNFTKRDPYADDILISTNNVRPVKYGLLLVGNSLCRIDSGTELYMQLVSWEVETSLHYTDLISYESLLEASTVGNKLKKVFKKRTFEEIFSCILGGIDDPMKNTAFKLVRYDFGDMYDMRPSAIIQYGTSGLFKLKAHPVGDGDFLKTEAIVEHSTKIKNIEGSVMLQGWSL